MLELNEFKQLVGENETDYHLSAQNYITCRHCILNILYE